MFEFKNKMLSTVSDAKAVRRDVTVQPATLKTLSLAALDAGIRRFCVGAPPFSVKIKQSSMKLGTLYIGSSDL